MQNSATRAPATRGLRLNPGKAQTSGITGWQRDDLAASASVRFPAAADVNSALVRRRGRNEIPSHQDEISQSPLAMA
jgi:hypothetical protein